MPEIASLQFQLRTPMPFINGKFYMNPAYGRAVEGARRSGAVANLDPAQQSHDRGRDDQDGRWVTIDGNHDLILAAHANGPARGAQRPATRSVARGKETPGTKAARIIFNETSGLRAPKGGAEDLHDGRVAIAHALGNGARMSRPPATVTDVLNHAAARSILTDPAAKAAWADSQGAVLEAAKSRDDTNGAVHFFPDYPGAPQPDWATVERETSHYGPFVNAAGGGNVPLGAEVTIRTHTLRPSYRGFGDEMGRSRLLGAIAVYISLVLPTYGQQSDRPITAREINEVKTAILDEIYDYKFEGAYVDISALTSPGYKIPLYIRPTVIQGSGQVIYKLPIGEVAGIFEFAKDLAVLVREPRDKFPPTSSSTLTFYLDDEEICADKRN
jgi:hypothetical protein